MGLGVRLIPENWACNAKVEVGLGEMFVYGPELMKYQGLGLGHKAQYNNLIEMKPLYLQKKKKEDFISFNYSLF